MTAIDNLIITMTKTANGQREYVQIISDDQFSVNVALIAQHIKVKDSRHVQPLRKKP